MGCVCVICVNLLYFCKWETFITGLFHARLCTNHFTYITLLILTTLWGWCFFYLHLYTRKLKLRKIKWLAMFRKLVNLLRIWTSQMPKPISTGFFTFFFPWQCALPFLQQHFTLYGVHLFWYAVVSLPISFCWTFTCFSLFSFRNNIVITSFVYIHDCLSRANYCKWHCWISPRCGNESLRCLMHSASCLFKRLWEFIFPPAEYGSTWWP